jgi:hypothetical protein
MEGKHEMHGRITLGSKSKLHNVIVERGMSAAVLTQGLEKREQARNGGSRIEARQRLARRVGISPGTLYNIARDRLKKLDAGVRDKLVAYAIRDLEQEIAGVTHELEMARQMGASPHSDLVLQAQTVLARAQHLFSEVTGWTKP